MISDFHTALGQFINYRIALEDREPERTLYLAVPDDVYDAFFTRHFGRIVVERNQLKLIVYNVEQEEVIKWQE